MADNTSNKFKDFRNIKLDDLYIGPSNVRVENVDDVDAIADLAEHIGMHGLLEPIVVFDNRELDEDHDLYESRKDYKEKKEFFEILAGQRRWIAFKKLREDGGKGWEKIPCHIREAPKDDGDAKAISLGEGLTQLPFTLADTQNACNELFEIHNDAKIVSKKTGISIQLVNRYVKYKRLDDIVKDGLTTIHKNPKMATRLAVEASDALTGSEEAPEPEKILALAQKLGQKKTKSEEEYKKIKQAAEENPNESIETIEKEGEKIERPRKLSIILIAKTANKLDRAAEDHGVGPEDEAVDIIEEGLGIRQAKTNE
mgnify:CR=1 FL=1